MPPTFRDMIPLMRCDDTYLLVASPAEANGSSGPGFTYDFDTGRLTEFPNKQVVFKWGEWEDLPAGTTMATLLAQYPATKSLKYSDDQPRDDSGRWTDDGGGGGGQPGLPYQPDAQRANLAMSDHKAAIAEYAKKVGKSPKQVERTIYYKLKDKIDNGQVSIRTPEEAIPGLIASGRYQTQFETGETAQNADYFDPAERAIVEQYGLGVPRDIDVQYRPVYGYINTGDPDDQDEVWAYGNVELTLSEHVRERATVTLGDSYGGMGAEVLVGAPIDDPHLGSWNEQFIPDLYEQANVPAYIETQIHGGVRMADVGRVTFHGEAGASAADLRERFSAMRALLRKNYPDLEVVYDAVNK